MSDVIIPYEFLCRGGTAAAVAAWNGIPRSRQMIIETDTGRFKVGDGTTHYNDLPYFAGPIGDLSDVNAPAPNDGDVLTWNAGAGEWQPTSVGTGMTYKSIATVSGAAATDLTLSGLDLDSDGHYYIPFMFKNAVGSAADIRLLCNGDTTLTNYYNQFVSGNGGVSGARANSPFVTGMAASEGVTGVITITQGYDGKPRAVVQSNRGQPSAIIMQTFAHAWVTTANLTSITIQTTVASALAIGSYLKAFRVN